MNTLKHVAPPGESPAPGGVRPCPSRTEYKLFRLKKGGPPSNKGIPFVRDSEEYREGTDEKYLEQQRAEKDPTT